MEHQHGDLDWIIGGSRKIVPMDPLIRRESETDVFLRDSGCRLASEAALVGAPGGYRIPAARRESDGYRESGAYRESDVRQESGAGQERGVRQEFDVDRGEETQRLREAVQSLIDAYGPRPAVVQPDIHVGVVTRHSEMAAAMSELAGTARETVSAMHPGPVPTPLDLRHTLNADRKLIERGIRVRRLNQLRLGSSTESSAGCDQLADIGVELRLTPVVPMHMVIADRDMAVMPLDPDDPEQGMVVLRGAPLVHSAAALFDQVWRDSRRYDAVKPDASRLQLTDEQLAIARMLAAGDNDKRIARALGVSQRTMSRKVADLMLQLRADTRFAAGVRAAQLDLLGPSDLAGPALGPALGPTLAQEVPTR